MAKLNVEGFGEWEVVDGKRLVLALVDDAGVDQLHACGGFGRCTTCQVEFLEGEPGSMTPTEEETLRERSLQGVRLSCQISCTGDMTVRTLKRLEGSGRTDAGNRPADTIEP